MSAAFYLIIQHIMELLCHTCPAIYRGERGFNCIREEIRVLFI